MTEPCKTVPVEPTEAMLKVERRAHEVERRLSELAFAVRRVMDAREAFRSPDRVQHHNLVREEAEAWVALQSVMEGNLAAAPEPLRLSADQLEVVERVRAVFEGVRGDYLTHTMVRIEDLRSILALIDQGKAP